MRKKNPNEKPEGLDRWLLTYADIITLLMAFFIMVYSMSVLNMSKFRQAAISIRSGFGGTVPGQGKSILGSSGVFGPKPSPIQGDTAGVSWKVLKPLVYYIDKEARERKNVGIGEDERGIIVTMSSDSLLFESGSADLQPQALPFLDRVARTLKRTVNQIRVEGHTCNLAPRGSRYASNWELSTARATGVLRYLVEQHGLPASRFSAAGYGSARPLVRNSSETNRARNRRVEIIIVRPEVAVAITPKTLPRRIDAPNRFVIQRRLD